MAQSLPFSALLDVLRGRGLEIGLVEYRDLALLLSRYDGQSRDELRHAIAALFARDQVEWQTIADCYDELFPPDTLPAPPTTPAPPPPPNKGTAVRRPWTLRKKVLTGLAGVIVAVLLVPVVTAWLTPTPAPPVRIDEPQPGPDTGPTPPPPAPQPPPAPRRTKWTSLLLPGVVSGAALLALAIALRTSGRRERWRRTVRRADLASIAGPRFYRWPVDHRAMAIPRSVVEEMATILGRRHEVSRSGHHLDVPMTVRRTLESGLFPRIVFEPPCRTRPLLVLHDVAPEMRPWKSRVDMLLRDLNRLGIPIRRFYFDASARTLWRSDVDTPTTLEELSRSEDDAALMVISTGAGIAAAMADDARSWLRVLEKWAARTWITPLTSRAHWRAELADAPMRVWPMTPGGLNAAARDLLFDSSHRTSAPPGALAGARAVSDDDLERVKRLVAVVPQPAPVEVVDALRARFTPDVPPDVLLPLLAQNDVLDSAHVRLPPGEVKRLLAALRRDDPDRETAVRRFLLGLLESTEPPADTAAHLRWQTDVALQHAQIAELAGGDPARSIEALQALAAGPLAEEVGTRARAVAASGRLSGPLEQVARSSRDAVSTTASAIPKPRLAPPRLADLLLTGAATAAAIGIFVLAGGLKAETIEHVQNAFALKWDANTGRLEMTLSDPAVGAQYGRSSLTRDREVVDQFDWNGVRVYTPRPEQRGAWYQVTSPLPAGNLALSNAVWVPAAAAPPPPVTATTGFVLATVRTADNQPAPGMPTALRNLVTGRIEATANSGQTGDFRFAGVPAGTYVVEATGADGRLVAAGNAFSLGPGETISTFIRLPAIKSRTLEIRLTNVYGEPLRSLEGIGEVRDASGAVLGTAKIDRSGLSLAVRAPAPYRISVAPRSFEPAAFTVTEAMAAKGPVTRSLIVPLAEIGGVSGLPTQYKGLDLLDVGADETMTILNALQRAERTALTVERPQGTWSRSLLQVIERLTRFHSGGATAMVRSEDSVYVQTWFRLRQQAGDVRRLNAAYRSQQPPPAPRPMTTSIRSGQTILDLRLDADRLLDMSMRRASDGTSDPFIIHQLLVQDGFPPLFRLRTGAPASAK